MIKFNTATYEATYNDCPAGYATLWIFSVNETIDYAADVAGLDYLELTEMTWHDAKIQATKWAETNEYTEVFVSKDTAQSTAPVWGA